ncbi:MAG: hypothetical protein ACT4N4_13755 [Rhodospirillales bacterium]
MLGWLSKAMRKHNRPRRRVGTAVELGEFLSRQSFFIAQKCVDDYCKGKVGVAIFALGTEAAFKNALTLCRWEGYAAMLAATAATVQRSLIDAGAPAGRVEACLLGLVDKILAAHPRPAHRPDGWADILGPLPDRLRWARGEPRPPLAAIAAPAARRLFDVLPFHPSHRELDEEVVSNAVQFQFVGFSDRLRREVDLGAVALEIASLGDGARAGTGPGEAASG